jgi:hypothetical protein
VIQTSQQLFTGLSLERICQLLAVNRGSYYRNRQLPATLLRDQELREAIEVVVLEYPGYG